MPGRLPGKVCIVTGTGGSMGHATALTFAREGAQVVGCDEAVERIDVLFNLAGRSQSRPPAEQLAPTTTRKGARVIADITPESAASPMQPGDCAAILGA